MTVFRKNDARQRAFFYPEAERPRAPLFSIICGSGASLDGVLSAGAEDAEVIVLSPNGHCADSRVRFASSSPAAAAGQARGKYVAFLQDGCKLMNGALAVCAAAVKEGADVICGNFAVNKEAVMLGVFSRLDMLSCDCMRGLLLAESELSASVGAPDALDEASLYRYALRLSERARAVRRVDEVLAELPPTDVRSVSALRRASSGELKKSFQTMTGSFAGSLRVRPPASSSGIAVMIPCSGGFGELRDCLTSLESETMFENVEYVIADIGASEPKLKRYFDVLSRNGAARIMSFADKTPLSDVLNDCAKHTRAGDLVFMSPRCRVLSPDWIESLLEAKALGRVGAVGARLTREDGALVHAGLIIGLRGWFDSPFAGARREHTRTWDMYVERIRQVSAVSTRCMLVDADCFWSVGGFGAGMGFGCDVDLCLKLGRAGFASVYTPYARLSCGSLIADEFPVPERELVCCYDSIRSTLISGDPYCGRSYDMRYTSLRAVDDPAPAIRLNPLNKG